MRNLNVIAEEITKDWTKPNFAAKPYLDAMFSLTTKDSRYGFDSASTIVMYFLSNASSWRGDTAKRIKAELKYFI